MMQDNKHSKRLYKNLKANIYLGSAAVVTVVPRRSQRQAKLEPYFFCLPCFESHNTVLYNSVILYITKRQCYTTCYIIHIRLYNVVFF